MLHYIEITCASYSPDVIGKLITILSEQIYFLWKNIFTMNIIE